jgi:hypothetical protein
MSNSPYALAILAIILLITRPISAFAAHVRTSPGPPAIFSVHHETISQPHGPSKLRVVWEFTNSANTTLYILVATPMYETEDNVLTLDHSSRGTRIDTQPNETPGFSFLAVPPNGSAQLSMDYWMEPSKRRGQLAVVGRFAYGYSKPDPAWEKRKNWEAVKTWQSVAEASAFWARSR